MSRVCRKTEIKEFTEVFKAAAKVFPVVFAGFDKRRKFFQLNPSNGSLGVKRLQVIAKVAVYVFVIIALR
jgi:hypothetical protein